MNSDYYFQKGLRLIVTGVVVLALIILFCGMVSQGFPLWLALVLLVPAGLGVVGFYFQPGQFGRSFGTVFPSVWA